MKKGVRAVLLPLGDILMLMVAFFIMLEVAFPKKISQEIINSHFLPFLVVFIVWIFVFFLFNLYETESIKPTIPNLKRIGGASMVAFTASIVLFYMIPDFGITPKTNLVIFSAIFLLLFIVWRRFCFKIFSAYFKKSVTFVVNQEKDAPYTGEIINYIKAYPQSGFFLLNIYSSLKEFWERKDERQVDTLVVSKNTFVENQEIKLPYNKVENILDLAYAYENILGKIPVNSIDETWFLYNIRNTNKTFYETTTRFLNIVISFIVLIAVSPFFLFVALFIKLEDGGPIFYIQPRIGKNGKAFDFYKFRSMIVNADQTGPEWTEKKDPRITKVGKIIRRLHIDETPQFLNVFLGDMALVGPRPEIPSFEEKLKKEIHHYSLRHIITPGFTGWAQIKFRNARGVAESKEKFEYDLYYIKNRNIFMDFGILLRTVVIIFTHDS